MKARVANGMAAASLLRGHTVLLVGTHRYPLPFEQLDGCTDHILSVPYMASIGFDALLTTTGGQLTAPCGTRINVHRNSRRPRQCGTST